MLGALLGQALDRRLQLHSWAQVRERLGGRPALRNDELLFVLLGRLAKSDGRVMDGHIQQARQEMRSLEMNDAAQRRAIAAFNRGKSGNDRLRGYLRRLATQPHAAEGVLRACWRMVWADGRVGPAERELIQLWGKWLGWTREQVQALAQDYGPARKSLAEGALTYQEALRLLGLQLPASRRRSSGPIGACSVAITRTRSPATAPARHRCVRLRKRPGSCTAPMP
ncbi:hypothetical protein PBOI14_70400 [Pseudomonas sp. Boi14]|nr:hypothetical protein PBOI14_70400 [Pseudomonas sp. Boi14]